MLTTLLSRHSFFAAISLLLAAVSGVFGQQSSLSPERTKREFMALAIDDINNRNKATVDEQKRIEAQGGKAPLFVALPVIRPFGDWDYYYLEDKLIWAPPTGKKLPTVTVPKGFVSDLASVPRLLWSAYTPGGRYAYAAIVHDYLYWTRKTSKNDADEIFKIAMSDAKVSAKTVTEFHTAVKVVGESAWKGNQAAKRNGEKRFLSQLPTDPLISWNEWKSKPEVFADQDS